MCRNVQKRDEMKSQDNRSPRAHQLLRPEAACTEAVAAVMQSPSLCRTLWHNDKDVAEDVFVVLRCSWSADRCLTIVLIGSMHHALRSTREWAMLSCPAHCVNCPTHSQGTLLFQAVLQKLGLQRETYCIWDWHNVPTKPQMHFMPHWCGEMAPGNAWKLMARAI